MCSCDILQLTFVSGWVFDITHYYPAIFYLMASVVFLSTLMLVWPCMAQRINSQKKQPQSIGAEQKISVQLSQNHPDEKYVPYNLSSNQSTIYILLHITVNYITMIYFAAYVSVVTVIVVNAIFALSMLLLILLLYYCLCCSNVGTHQHLHQQKPILLTQQQLLKRLQFLYFICFYS